MAQPSYVLLDVNAACGGHRGLRKGGEGRSTQETAAPSAARERTKDNGKNSTPTTTSQFDDGGFLYVCQSLDAMSFVRRETLIMQRRRTQLKTEAHKRIDEGHAVIPLVRNGKAPLWKGWQEKATTDHTAIDTRWPDDVNIGSVTRSRLVVDCDVKNGEHGAWNFTHWLVENGLDSRPPTLIVVTPSGGSHVYYDRPADLILGNSTGSLPAGIDVRGRGGFVVAEGSVINGRKYYRHGNSADTIAPMPQPLIDALVRPVRSAVVPPRAAQPGGGRDYFEEACVRVSALRRGSRHVELLRIANRVGHLMADGVITYHRSVIEGELLDAVSQQAEPDDLRSAEITIRDGLDNALRTHVYRPVHAVPPPLSEGLGV